MGLTLRRCLLALVTACDRGRGPTPPGAAPPSGPTAADPPGAIKLPRPGPDDADRSLLLRLRRGLDLPLQISEVLRSGDAWLVVYTYNESEAWWREVHRTGKAAETLATLGRRRRQCEAALRTPEEETDEPAPTVDVDPGFSVDSDNAMDDRSCWELAMASLAPHPGPFVDDCDAIGIARVTADTVESLYSSDGTCTRSHAAFELRDVAGAGWPQLILQYSDITWDLTRVGFQEATSADHLIILDPRTGHAPVMLDETLESEDIVGEGWYFRGHHAHVEIRPGRHLTVYRQDWETRQEGCEQGPDGWVLETEDEETVADEDEGDYDGDSACTAQWTVTRNLWDAKAGKWSDRGKALPEPTRPPVRATELPVDLEPPPPPEKKPAKKKKKK